MTSRIEVGTVAYWAPGSLSVHTGVNVWEKSVLVFHLPEAGLKGIQGCNYQDLPTNTVSITRTGEGSNTAVACVCVVEQILQFTVRFDRTKKIFHMFCGADTDLLCVILLQECKTITSPCC